MQPTKVRCGNLKPLVHLYTKNRLFSDVGDILCTEVKFLIENICIFTVFILLGAGEGVDAFFFFLRKFNQVIEVHL